MAVLDGAGRDAATTPVKCVHWYVMVRGGMVCKKCGRVLGSQT